MSHDAPPLSAQARAIVDQEEALLKRSLASIHKAINAASLRRPQGDLRSVESLRSLREEAVTAQADDLPALLLEMSVRQRLLERPDEHAVPDPACPYIGHLRVNEGASSKDYLLGRVTFVDTSAAVRIIDWRLAPVAQIFYRYREGDDYEEEFPGRTAEGVVEARRIVVIERGVLTQIIGDSIVLTRAKSGAWTASERGTLALSPGGAGSAARPGSLGIGAGALDRIASADITAMLDAEQHAAICAPAEQPLLVLGSAGSGKTTVALHRLARIAASSPKQYPLSDVKVVVPEEGLARLSRRLLEPLGVGSAQVQNLDEWSIELARQVFGDGIALSYEPPALVTGLKRHPAFYESIRQSLAKINRKNATLRGLRRRLSELLTDRGFLSAVVEASGGDLPRTAIEETVRHTMLQLAEPLERQLRSITVKARKRAIDGRPIWESTPDEQAGTVDLEDLPVLLFLRAWRVGMDAQPLAHLVLDEAVDFTLFELYVLGRLLAEERSVTLAGDEAQQMSSSFAGWKQVLDTLGVGDAAICRLQVSYRCPRPVAEFAHRILGTLAPETPARAAREGAPIGFFHFPDERQAHLFLAGAVADLAAREPRASVAVIANTAETARRFHALIADSPEARLVLQGEFSFEPGIDITDLDNAKGLEFDYVVVPDASAENYPTTEEARRRLHVAVTRTSHQLWVVAPGSPCVWVQP